jgi:hypothetical protein
MKSWLALLGAPSMVLACLSLNYALVEPACQLGSRVLLHRVSGASFVVCSLATLLALQRWRALGLATADDGALPARAGFMAAVGVGVGTLSALSVIAISIPQWLIRAC